MRQEDTKCRLLARANNSPLETKRHNNSSLIIEPSNDKFQDLTHNTKTPPSSSQSLIRLTFSSSKSTQVKLLKT